MREPKSAAQRPQGRVTLTEWVRRRNGVPLGASGALRNMLHRSFGARNFAGFWQYWNPVFGYWLARYVHAPLQRVLPSAVALILTFVICGAVHDLVASAIRGTPTFPFSVWFLILGGGVVAGRAAGMDLSRRPWAFRAGVHLVYLVVCAMVAIVARRELGIP